MKTTGDAVTAGLVAANTTLAPCVAGPVVFLIKACLEERLDVCSFCNGILAGLVAITAGCAAVEPWEAIIIGFIGGLVYQGSSMLLKKLRLDDVVDAVPVHGACGLWGLLALGFFGDEKIGGNGVFHGGDQLGTQIVAAIFIILWVGGLSALIFVPLQKAGWLTLDDEIQIAGADAKEHSPGKAYSDEKQVQKDASMDV